MKSAVSNMAEDRNKTAGGDPEKGASKQASPAVQQKNAGSKGASPNKAAGKGNGSVVLVMLR